MHNFVPDIDECEKQNGGCSHQCVNTDGSYSCFCPRGLEIGDDQHNCRGEII